MDIFQTEEIISLDVIAENGFQIAVEYCPLCGDKNCENLECTETEIEE